MEYISTRDKTKIVNSAQAIAMGIADDGGLFCPKEFPKICDNEILSLIDFDYKKRASFIFSKFLTDFTQDEIDEFCKKAYSNEKFEDGNIAPVVSLSEGKNILELWHGPTCAFKDMALQILPHFLTASLKKLGENRTTCILVATSGDTGKAALDGFANVKGTKIIVYYPFYGVSKIQKLQMTTQEGENVQVIAIDGNFDDAQSAVKKIFTDEHTKNKMNKNNMMFSSANSINWGRLLPQIVYYVSAYCDMVKNKTIKNGEKINICVPTGNFGNILAAYFAKQMGIPVNKLICASNKNNVLTDFFKNNGIYDKNREFYKTNSPSMDILVSSNLERLLFYVSGQNSELIKQYMENLNLYGKYQISKEIYEKICCYFDAGYCDDEKTKQTIKNIWENEKYLCDTHTAVAINVYNEYRERTGDKTQTIIVSTASPFKFCNDVIKAIDDKKSLNCDDIISLDILSDITNIKKPKPLSNLYDKKIRFDKIINKNEILKTVDILIEN